MGLEKPVPEEREREDWWVNSLSGVSWWIAFGVVGGGNSSWLVEDGGRKGEMRAVLGQVTSNFLCGGVSTVVVNACYGWWDDVMWYVVVIYIYVCIYYTLWWSINLIVEERSEGEVEKPHTDWRGSGPFSQRRRVPIRKECLLVSAGMKEIARINPLRKTLIKSNCCF